MNSNNNNSSSNHDEDQHQGGFSLAIIVTVFISKIQNQVDLPRVTASPMIEQQV